MLSGPHRVRLALTTFSFVVASAAVAQTWINPPPGQPPTENRAAELGGQRLTEGAAGPGVSGDKVANPRATRASQERQAGATSTGSRLQRGKAVPRSVQKVQTDARYERALAARDFAYDYLDHWSAPNRVSLSSAGSAYGPTVKFHGRSLDHSGVIEEKRRFAERWPRRTYRYRPKTTQVWCETRGVRCTVWSIFDFSAANPNRKRRSRGIGEHEVVVSFSDAKPVIVSENSRVLFREDMQSR